VKLLASVVVLAAFALVLAAPAGTKEVRRVVACGPDACQRLGGSLGFLALFDRPGDPKPPPPPAERRRW
jgi:hypothetical protein